MTDPITYELSDGIATVTLANGKVNAISPQVIEGLHGALDRSEQDRAVVILTGRSGMLSGGYDLKVMTAGPQQAIDLVTAGSRLARRMLAHPLPIVIACGGHAVAKGGFLLLSADHRVGVSGPYRIGLNEIAIGMTMHHVGIELARHRLSKTYFNRCVMNAEMLSPEQAVPAGFLDEVVAETDLTDTARARAEQLSKLNLQAHAATKVKARAEFLATLDRAIDLDQGLPAPSIA